MKTISPCLEGEDEDEDEEDTNEDEGKKSEMKKKTHGTERRGAKGGK
jgi:hypothetical protein